MRSTTQNTLYHQAYRAKNRNRIRAYNRKFMAAWRAKQKQKDQ